jgi:hypothetical protein
MCSPIARVATDFLADRLTDIADSPTRTELVDSPTRSLTAQIDRHHGCGVCPQHPRFVDLRWATTASTSTNSALGASPSSDQMLIGFRFGPDEFVRQDADESNAHTDGANKAVSDVNRPVALSSSSLSLLWPHVEDDDSTLMDDALARVIAHEAAELEHNAAAVQRAIETLTQR